LIATTPCGFSIARSRCRATPASRTRSAPPGRRALLVRLRQQDADRNVPCGSRWRALPAGRLRIDADCEPRVRA
jgi:hypothetical protein